MAEHLQAVWQQVEAFDWRSWSSEEKQALHKGLCRHGDEWDRVAGVVGSKPKNEVVLAAIKLMLEEPDFLQHCGPELQPRLKKFINQQRQQQQDALKQQKQQGLQRYESYSVDQPARPQQQQQRQQQSIDLQVAESTNLASMQVLEQQLEQWQQQLIRHEQQPLPPLPPQQQQRLLGAKRLSDTPDPVLPDDVELIDQIRPTKRHQCHLPDATAVAAALAAPGFLTQAGLQPQQQQQQQQQQTGSPGAAAGPATVNLSPQAAAVLAAHQQLLAAASTQQSQVQQQQQMLLAAAQQQQQLLRQQQLLQSLAGVPKDTVLGSSAARSAYLQLLQQQQQLPLSQQQQNMRLLQQTLSPSHLQQVAAASAAFPVIPAAARTAQQVQQQLAAAAAAAQFSAAAPMRSTPFGAVNISTGLLMSNQTAAAAAAGGPQGLAPADVANLACLPNPAAAAATAAALAPSAPRLITSQSPANTLGLFGRNNQASVGITGLPASAVAAAAPAGVPYSQSGLAPAPGSLAHGLAAAATAPQSLQQQQQQQQQQQHRVSDTSQAFNQGLINTAANFGTVLGAAAGTAAVDPRAAAAAAADMPPVQTLPAAQALISAQQQQQQQRAMGLQQRKLMTQLMQQQLLHAAAPPAMATSPIAGQAQADSFAVVLQALMAQQQQQQQPRPNAPACDLQQLFQNATSPTAADIPAADSNAVLSWLGALGTPSATAAATPPAAALAAAAVGGWNAAAFAALAGGPAALTPGNDTFKMNPLLPGLGSQTPIGSNRVTNRNNTFGPGLDLLGAANLEFKLGNPVTPGPVLNGLNGLGNATGVLCNDVQGGLQIGLRGGMCNGEQAGLNGNGLQGGQVGGGVYNPVAGVDSGTASTESVDESSPLGSEGTPLTSDSHELADNDEQCTADGYESEGSSES